MTGGGLSLRVAMVVVVVATALSGARSGALTVERLGPPSALGQLTTSAHGVLPSRRSPEAAPLASVRKGYWYSYGPNHSRRVALTFDDCPTSLQSVRRVLDGAQRLGIGLMLFPTGQCLRRGRFPISYARSHGHYLFNHSVSHPDLTRLSYAGVLRQLASPGVQSRYGRPPYGSYNATVARAYRAKGMKIWTWNVDTNDWHGYSRATVVRQVVRQAAAGSTVLMHMQWHAFSVKALRQIKTGLASRGLSVCRNYPGTTPARSWTVRC